MAEEKEQVARLNEQLQQEQSRKEQELKETTDNHESQIRSLQEKISTLVSILGQSQKRCVLENYVTHTGLNLFFCYFKICSLRSGKSPIYFT